MLGKSLLLLAGVFVVVCSNDQAGPVIQTTNGRVRGFLQKSSKGETFYSFLAIPYASPPVGNLRFQPPKTFKEWNGILDGTSQPPMCIQCDSESGLGVAGQEDCLYLNVFSKKLPQDTGHPNLPVMVWIHGGAFRMGSGIPDHYSPIILLNKDIVLVTINYRLGAFGFLSTADHIVQGNMGLKDQNMALRWVKENINAFGGDADRITIAGESAGAASVHYHMLSSKSTGLFHRAITQSGTALCPWAYSEPEEMRKKSKRLASLLNCPTDDTESMLSCLQNADATSVASATPKFAEWLMFPQATFVPTREVAGEDMFMELSPRESASRGEQVDIPWMIGICEFEGEFVISGIWKKGLLEDLDKHFLEIIPFMLEYNQVTKHPDQYSKEIRNFYFGNGTVHLDGLINMLSDSAINTCSYEAVNKYFSTKKRVSSTYFYEISFLGAFSFSQVPWPFGGGANYKPKGATHVDDLIYLFLFPFGTVFEKGSREEMFSDKMTTLWSNFLATGNPTPGDKNDFEEFWDPLELQPFNNFKISLSPKMQTTFYPDRISFWTALQDRMRSGGPEPKEEL